MQEGVHLRLDDRLGLRHRRLARIHAFTNHRGEIIDRVEEHVIHRADLRLDIARHRKIDHEHRVVTAGAYRALHHALADDRQRTRGAGHHDVEFRQHLGQVAQRDRAPAEPLRKVIRAFKRAVGEGHDLRVLRGEVGGCEFDHLARSDEQHLLLRDRGEDAFGQSHRGGGHRHYVGTDRGIAADFLGNREGPLKQLVQRGAERARSLGRAHRPLQLTEDLRLTQHHRVQSRGDAKGVTDGVLRGERVGVRMQVLRLEAVESRQPFECLRGLGIGPAPGHHVQLGSVAGGQDRGLAGGP